MTQRDTPPDSNEALREALYAAQYQAALVERVNAQMKVLLDALELLMGKGFGDDTFLRVFDSLRRGFSFSHAMLLVQKDDKEKMLECIVAEQAHLIGSRWPVGPLFKKVLAGRTLATISGENLPDWEKAVELGCSAQDSALMAPVKTHSTRGILLVVRSAGQTGFNTFQVRLLRHYVLLVSNALLARESIEKDMESRRLLDLSMRLRDSERKAQRNADLLGEVVQAMSIGVSVQDSVGRLQLINKAGARALGHSGEAAELLGERPPGFDARQFASRLRARTSSSQEMDALLDGEARTIQVVSKPVNILGEPLLLETWLDITEHRHFESEIRRHILHDYLTGLPNRVLAKEIVENTIRSNHNARRFVLAVLNIDDFKQINDYHGHVFGDYVLATVARRVRDVLRPTDTLARISGDEFMLLLDPVNNAAIGDRVLDKIIQVVREPLRFEGRELFVSCSIGAAFFPQHGHDYESLGRAADNALSRIKAEHRGSAGFFDFDLDGSRSVVIDLELRLRAAVRRKGSFRAAYQPKVCLNDLDSPQVIAFEALVRWVEDDKIHLPGLFIEAAARIGLLNDITMDVIDAIAADLPALRQCYGKELSINFNVSALQLADDDFIAQMLARIDGHGIAPALVLELTEDALVARQQFQENVLPKLRKSGLRVSIDDFGTGYSSLSMLADITADECKIDRAFVSSIHERKRSQSVLKAIDSVCNALSISTVAEGVETLEELEYLLRNTAIRIVQGYYYGRPAFVEHWLEKRPDLKPDPAPERLPVAVLSPHMSAPE